MGIPNTSPMCKRVGSFRVSSSGCSNEDSVYEPDVAEASGAGEAEL